MISYIVSKLIIRGLALSITLIALLLPICANAKSDGFDYPAGAPNANNYYNAQGFGEWNSRFSGYHLGEDWNKKCGGDCDLGDTLSSISGGTVISKKNLKTWGNIVIMRHDLGNLVIDSMYAHLKDVNVSEGELINRGKAVGTVGKGENNIFPAHLHFEIRDNLTVGAGTGYGSFKPKGWQEPTAFINYHRPVPAPPPVANPNIAVTTKDGINTIAWDRASEGFDRYEVYRGGALVSTITDQNQLIFEDKNISGGNTYKCKVLAIYKNGQVGTSSEVDIEVKREVKKVTPSLGEDRNPFIYDGNVFYQSVPQRPGSKDLPLLYYYDIASGETKSVDISGCGFKYPNSPNANAGIVAFYAATTQTSQNDICYYNFSTDTAVPVSFEPVKGEQWYPAVSDEGLIFWEDMRNGNNFDIYFLDPKKSNGPEPFVVAAKNQRLAKVSGNKVVWKDSRNYTTNEYDFYMKELGGSEETKIVTNVGDSFYGFWDKYIVWDFRGKLNLYNLETKATTVIQNTNVNSFPTVNGGKVAYSQREGGKGYIHIYDIVTAKDTKLDFDIGGSQPVLSVGGDYLAFDLRTKKENNLSDFDIYLVKL